ncbi:MAG TPA: hypothetical protein PLL57_10135 [Flavobacteriales bacterium]|nr:hypothetical protein [Flavobacteriales bacterium]
MEFLRSRRSLLALMLLLGLQFCYPQGAVAQQNAAVVGVAGLGVKDPECKPGLPVDLDLAPPFVFVFVSVGTDFVPDAFVRPPLEVPGTSVLPTTGVHPSAP